MASHPKVTAIGKTAPRGRVARPARGGRHSDGYRWMEHERRISIIEKLAPTLATKREMETLKDELRALTLFTKTGFAELRADLHKMDANIKSWMIGTIIGLFFGFSGLFVAMNSASRASYPASTPIVVTVPSPSGPVSALAQRP